MNLPPLTQRFVLHFGEMGSRWGINRTVGQIYALLFVSAKPLNADEVGEALGFSRSNVSMGLKELQSWNLVRLIHQPNDRREYFQAPEDVWAIFRTLAAERRKREIDPTLSMLRDALMEQPSVAEDIHAQERMRQMHGFIELMTDWLDDVQKMDSATLASLMQMGAKVQKFLEIKDRVLQVFTGKGMAETALRQSSLELTQHTNDSPTPVVNTLAATLEPAVPLPAAVVVPSVAPAGGHDGQP